MRAFVRELSGGQAQVSVGLIVDADQAGPGLAATAGIRLALAGSRDRLAEWLASIAGGPAQIALSPSGAGLAAPGQAAVFVPLAPGRDLDRVVGEAAGLAAGRPVLVEVPVSVGRTTAEAQARADSEELFALVGHPAASGLFGTLEECQAGAARLAHAGATELVCYLPHSHLPHPGELTDVLAQLRAIAIGAGVLRPGEPPSSPPPPPDGWGGRRPAG